MSVDVNDLMESEFSKLSGFLDDFDPLGVAFTAAWDTVVEFVNFLSVMPVEYPEWMPVFMVLGTLFFEKSLRPVVGVERIGYSGNSGLKGYSVRGAIHPKGVVSGSLKKRL